MLKRTHVVENRNGKFTLVTDRGPEDPKWLKPTVTITTLDREGAERVAAFMNGETDAWYHPELF